MKPKQLIYSFSFIRFHDSSQIFLKATDTLYNYLLKATDTLYNYLLKATDRIKPLSANIIVNNHIVLLKVYGLQCKNLWVLTYNYEAENKGIRFIPIWKWLLA